MLAGEVTAVELHPGRARELAENVERLGRVNVRVVNADVRSLDEGCFDRALVDAPCSGLGVLGRRPDLRWRSRPLPALQARAARRRGGAHTPGRAGRLLGLHDQRRRERGRRRRFGPRAGATRRRVARLSCTPADPSSCSARPTATERQASSSPGSASRSPGSASAGSFRPARIRTASNGRSDSGLRRGLRHGRKETSALCTS